MHGESVANNHAFCESATLVHYPFFRLSSNFRRRSVECMGRYVEDTKQHDRFVLFCPHHIDDGSMECGGMLRLPPRSTRMYTTHLKTLTVFPVKVSCLTRSLVRVSSDSSIKMVPIIRARRWIWGEGNLTTGVSTGWTSLRYVEPKNSSGFIFRRKGNCFTLMLLHSCFRYYLLVVRTLNNHRTSRYVLTGQSVLTRTGSKKFPSLMPYIDCTCGTSTSGKSTLLLALALFLGLRRCNEKAGFPSYSAVHVVE